MVSTTDRYARLTAGKIIAVWLWVLTGLCAVAQSKDTIRFIHISDPHICFLDKFHPVIQKKRGHYGNGVPAFETLLRTSRNAAVDFITITGDLVDFFQGMSPDYKLIENQVEPFARLVRKSTVPVYMTLGNHDIASNFVENGDYYGSKFFAQHARAVWTRSIDCFKEGTYYSRIQQVGSTTYRFIFLDDGYYAKKPTGKEEDDFYFENEQLDWLEWQLNQSQEDVEIILMHIPFRPDKKNGAGSQRLFDLLIQHPSFKLLLAGHEHINEVHTFQSDKGQFTQVLTGAFGRDPQNWRLIKLTESGIQISRAGSGADEITISK